MTLCFITHLLSFLRLTHVYAGSVQIVAHLVLAHFSHHFLALVVLLSSIWRFFVLLLKFFFKEIIIVRFEESIQVFAGAYRTVKDLFLVICDASKVLTALKIILCMLQLNPLPLHFHGVLLLAHIFFLPCTSRISELWVFLGNANLLAEPIVFHLQFANSIFD